MSADLDEINVKALLAVTVSRAQSAALEVFEVYSPAFFMRVVRCEIMLRDWRSFADTGDIVPDFGGQVVDVVRVPRTVVAHRAAFWSSGQSTAK